MKSIVSRDDFQIIHNPSKNPNKFKIIFDLYSEELISSIIKTKIILGATVTDNYDTLIFNATTVKTFDNFHKEQTVLNGTRKLPIQIVSKMIYDLSCQLKYLIIYENKTFLGYNKKNIIVIDDNKYIYLTNEYLKDIDKYNDETIMVSSPFTTNDFYLSPELKVVKELPSYIHYKTSYYSLGKLILDLFFEEDNTEDVHVMLSNIHIKGTKLYWLLERMLKEEPQSRSIIYI